jgi:hypothetical protein
VLHRDLAQFDVPVAGELVPADLHRPADHVRLVGGLAGGLHLSRQRHFMAMPPSIAASLEPVVEQPMVLAASGEFHRSASMCTQRASISALCGILVLVDHVLVDALVHQLMDLRVQPGLAEGRQVLAGVAVQHQLVVHHLVSVARVMLVFRHLVLGHHDREVGRCDTVLYVCFFMQCHQCSPCFYERFDNQTEV